MAQIAGWQKVTSKTFESKNFNLVYFPVPTSDELVLSINAINLNASVELLFIIWMEQ